MEKSKSRDQFLFVSKPITLGNNKIVKLVCQALKILKIKKFVQIFLQIFFLEIWYR